MNLEIEEHIKLEFYTATILDWKTLLMPDKFRPIILSRLRFLV